MSRLTLPNVLLLCALAGVAQADDRAEQNPVYGGSVPPPSHPVRPGAADSWETTAEFDFTGENGSESVDPGHDGFVRPSIGTSRQPDFFIVSTVRCPQEPGDHGSCQLKVERFCQCGMYHRVTVDSMLASLQPGIPVCISVHGSFVPDPDVHELNESRYRQLIGDSGDRPIHMIGFHWPSDIGIPICPAVQANQLGKRAGFNGIYLAQLIRMIPESNPVSLLGHSHGTRVISSALHLLAGGCVDGFRVSDRHPSRRIRAVYGAAAIDSHWLNPHEKYGFALNRIECMLLFRTRLDLVLAAYPLQDPLLHHALGKSGYRPQDLSRIGYQSCKIRQMDVTHLVGCRHEAEAYMPHTEITRAMIPYLWFD